MYGKLNDEREKAKQLLQQKSTNSFNLSDLKNDKTVYLDNTPNRANSQFDMNEITARSTTFNRQSIGMNMDFGEIMKSSCSQAVRDKYRESMSMGRLSSLPKTADMSMRTSVASSNQQMDFWDEGAQPSFSSITGKNLTFSSESFRPAEEMSRQLKEDERAQEMEYATIPVKRLEETSTWSNVTSTRPPEMSFGQYCQEKVMLSDIREIYGNASPRKRSNRVALVELSSNESGMENSSISDPEKLRKLLKNYKTPQAENLLTKTNKHQKKTLFQEMHSKDESASSSCKQQNQDKTLLQEMLKNDFNPNSAQKGVPKMICEMMKGLNVERIMKKAEAEKNRMAAETEKERARRDVVPVKDDTVVDSENEESMRYNKKELQVPVRGLKRRTSSVSSETPRSALDKCLRSKSPTNIRELKIAATLLKPQILLNDESIFKIPRPFDSTLKSSSGVSTLNKTPSYHRSQNAISEPSNGLQSSKSSREYYTAKENFTLRSPEEKLSLPSYALQRPPISPSSSVRSIQSSQWSPDGSNINDGRLRRSASQMSNGSEFGDDFLPIKIKNLENRRLSFETVKIDRSATRNISIQNGCDKKLALKVRVVGAGFSVMPREEFRMVPLEARTFQVQFSPSIVGPSRGYLIFELANNKNCSKTIHLFAYGGHSNILIDGVQKGPFGPHFITLGCVKELNYSMERKLKLKNNGTLPAFASVVFERTKLSDFAMLDSLVVEPTQARIDPGRLVEVTIRFKATKAEIRKILSMNKDVTTIGEICIICGDEPTRLRILQGKDKIEQRFLQYLPKSLPGQMDLQAKLHKFKEELTREKITSIMNQIRTHEIALTINRNLDDTQILSTDMSLADDSYMNFETFVDTNATRINTNLITDIEHMQQTINDEEVLESNNFLITPTQIIFDRIRDDPSTSKYITIESTSTSNEDLLIEAISSNSKLIMASLSHGNLKRGERAEIKVNALKRAFEVYDPVSLMIFIKNDRIPIPVKFTN